MPCAGRGAGILSRLSPALVPGCVPRPAPCASWDHLMCPGQDGAGWELFPEQVPGLWFSPLVLWQRAGGTASCPQTWLGSGAVPAPVFWELQLGLPRHHPKSACLSLHLQPCGWGCVPSGQKQNDRPTPFIMFILTFCPEMGTVLREENCWALAENGLKLLNLKYVRWPLIQPRGARTALATRPSGGFVTSALRNIHSPALLLLLFQAALPRVHFVFVLVLLDVESRGKAGVSGWLWVPTGCGCRCGAVPHLAQFHGGGIVQQLGVEMLGFYTCACGLTQFQ